MARKNNYYSVTIQGLPIKVKKDVMDDIDLIDDLSLLDDGDVFAFPRVIKKLFGEKQYPIVKEHLAKKGITKASDMSKFMEETFNAVNALQAKN